MANLGWIVWWMFDDGVHIKVSGDEWLRVRVSVMFSQSHLKSFTCDLHVVLWIIELFYLFNYVMHTLLFQVVFQLQWITITWDITYKELTSLKMQWAADIIHLELTNVPPQKNPLWDCLFSLNSAIHGYSLTSEFCPPTTLWVFTIPHSVKYKILCWYHIYQAKIETYSHIFQNLKIIQFLV